MDWRESLFNTLARNPVVGYHAGQAEASEPTALAALALIGAGRSGDARRAVDWLVAAQAADGTVGVRFNEPEPRWPTSLAVLCWQAFLQANANPSNTEGTENNSKKSLPPYQNCVERAVQWIVSSYGKAIRRDPDMGHDPTIAAWAWVEGTHSWIEPTAFHLLALKATGRRDHERTRFGVACLFDRQLPSGGCNYGNTLVLGQELRPHSQPTGITLMALADEADVEGKLARAIAYLRGEVGPNMTTASLCYSLLGLTAHNQSPAEADQWLAHTYERVQRTGASAYKLALLANASLGVRSPLLALTRKVTS